LFCFPSTTSHFFSAAASPLSWPTGFFGRRRLLLSNIGCFLSYRHLDRRGDSGSLLRPFRSRFVVYIAHLLSVAVVRSDRRHQLDLDCSPPPLNDLRASRRLRRQESLALYCCRPWVITIGPPTLCSRRRRCFESIRL
jgi:hypothetical protein